MQKVISNVTLRAHAKIISHWRAGTRAVPDLPNTHGRDERARKHRHVMGGAKCHLSCCFTTCLTVGNMLTITRIDPAAAKPLAKKVTAPPFSQIMLETIKGTLNPGDAKSREQCNATQVFWQNHTAGLYDGWVVSSTGAVCRACGGGSPTHPQKWQLCGLVVLIHCQLEVRHIWSFQTSSRLRLLLRVVA